MGQRVGSWFALVPLLAACSGSDTAPGRLDGGSGTLDGATHTGGSTTRSGGGAGGASAGAGGAPGNGGAMPGTGGTYSGGTSGSGGGNSIREAGTDARPNPDGGDASDGTRPPSDASQGGADGASGSGGAGGAKDATTPVDASRDAGTGPDGSAEGGGPTPAACGSSVNAGGPRDLDWANWPVPPDVPTAYKVFPDVACDEVTGLLWGRVGSVGAAENVETSCNELGGVSGFRLPTAVELMSLLSYDGSGANAAFTLESGCYWASTQGSLAAGGTGQFVADIPGGTVTPFGVASGCRWLCVRSVGTAVHDTTPGAPAGRYAVTASVVTDNVTGLSWERSAQVGTGTAVEGECNSLSLGGHDDWRVPRIKELYTLSDHANGGKLDANAFPESTSTAHWSSTLVAGAAEVRAWTVSFVNGSITALPRSQSHSLRCVRP